MKIWMRGILVLKYVLLVLLLVFIVLLLGNGKVSRAKIDKVTGKVTAVMDMEGVSVSDNRMLKRLYGINANDYEGVSLYLADSNMKVEELLVVKLKDTEQSEEVENAVRKRLDRQLESFEGYGPEQCRMLEDHILDVQGNYVLYVVNSKAKAADKAFQNSL